MKLVKLQAYNKDKDYIINLDKICYVDLADSQVVFDDDQWVRLSEEGMSRLLEITGFKVDERYCIDD